MTNSEKQTTRGKSEKDASPSETRSEEAGRTSGLPAYASAEFWTRLVSERPTLVFGGALLLLGWGFSLHINRWHFTTPVIILWLGWLGVLATVRFLWTAGVAVASEVTSAEDEVLDVSEARRHELLAEKKSLLQAIKEIEFDRDLGKMSEGDAAEIMRFYRARAIEVIKDLDGEDDSSLTVNQRIERDLAARMELEKLKGSAKKVAGGASAKKPAAPAKEPASEEQKNPANEAPSAESSASAEGEEEAEEASA